MSSELPKQLTFTNGISLVVGTIIGSGIFASPGSVFRHAHSGGAALTLWACSGVLALCGALCYAELATKIPSAGGEVAYLKEGFGQVVSFLFTWTNVLVTRPCALGIISIVFGEYVCRFLAPPFGLDQTTCAHSALTSISAFICSIVVTFVNAVSTRAAASVMGFSTGSKVTVLVLIAFVGLVILTAAIAGNPINQREEGIIMSALSVANTSANVLDFPQALMSALWAYDGWNGLNYATEEMQSPSDLVSVIKLSVPLVATLYFAANSAYLIALPVDLVSNSQTVAVDLAESVAGIAGRVIMSLFVCVSAFGAAMGTVFSGSRLIYSAARDGQLPRVFSVLNATTGTPIRALALQWSITCLYLIVGDFDELVGVFGSATWTFYLLTVIGMLRLRRREEKLTATPIVEYTYQAPIIAPVLFCIVSAALVVIEFIARPLSGLIALGFTVIGLPVYYFTISRRAASGGEGWRPVNVSPRETNNTAQGVELLHESSQQQEDVLRA